MKKVIFHGYLMEIFAVASWYDNDMIKFEDPTMICGDTHNMIYCGM